MHKKILVSLCGYLPQMKKTALCFTNADSFSVVDDKTKKTVFSGTLSMSVSFPALGDNVRIADFSHLSAEGSYYVKCGFRRSDTFTINKDLCLGLNDILLAGIYINRCGWDFSSRGNTAPLRDDERFVHPACHTEMTPLMIGGGRIDASGGWHCGCGYGKSVTVTALSCAYMLYSMMLFGGRSCEQLSDECRWGMEWLLKMQAPDGGVYHKCDTLNINSWLEAPADDKSDYYIFPKSSQANFMFTAVTALAARVYEDIDPRFARKLSNAAANGWIWIMNTPDYEPWAPPSGADPNGIADVTDHDSNDDMMWVLSEMYALTGDELFERRFLDLVYRTDISGFSVNRTGGFAALAYLMNKEKRDASALFYIKKKFGDRADKILSASASDTFMPDMSCYDEYSNMRVLSDCIACEIAYMIFGSEKYLYAAEGLFQYVLGKNPMGISYITGTAESSPQRPYHALSSSSQTGTPVPGMLVSGPNYANRDNYSAWLLKHDTPPSKCYIDSEYSRSNEPAICYGAEAIMASMFFSNCGSAAFDNAVNL